MSIVEFPKPPNLRFKRDVVKTETFDPNTGQTYVSERIVIKLENMDNKRSRVHRYSDFLGNWVNSKPKTAMDIADYIVPFLNYITFTLSEERLPSIQHLTVEHGADYITNYSKGKITETVKKCEMALTRFYQFLDNKGVLNERPIFTRSERPNGKTSLDSLFLGKVCYYCTSPIEEPLHCIPFDLFYPLILTALRVVPRIAFGIYLQFMGGIRVGGIINMTYGALESVGPCFSKGINIRLQRRFLRSDLKGDTGRNSVKRPRVQHVEAIQPLLTQLYEFHTKKYRKHSSDAIFLGKNDKPMTKSTYTYYYTKMKHAFISELSKSEDPRLQTYAVQLSIKKWSTHLGRGFFSNLAIENSANIAEVAKMRGDRTFNAVVRYAVRSNKVADGVSKTMGDFYTRDISVEIEKLLKN